MESAPYIFGSVERRWPDEDTGPWVLRLTFGIVGDRPGVVAVELYAVTPAAIRRAVDGWPSLLLEPGRRKRRKPTAENRDLFETLGPETITTAGMRVPLAELTTEYLARLERSAKIAASPGATGRLPDAWRRAAAEQLERLRAPERRHGPGRPAAYGAEHYEKVAEIYLQALREGRSPTKAVADALAGGYPQGKSAAAKWVVRCRELGLLPAAVKGKAAGWPITPPKRRQRRR